MTACTLDPIILLIGFLISISLSILIYKFILNKFITKQRWISIIIAILLFMLLFYFVGFSEICTGPLIGPGGEILG